MSETHDRAKAGGEAQKHPRFLAHHYGSYQAQFEAGKLGMWIFLLTEILLFSGLFCAYAVYRANHPEIFHEGAEFLNTYLGATNTCVLLLSSLTMAWGVRCAQTNRPRGLVVCLVVTLLCGGLFMGIKYVEYRHKWHDGLLWAGRFEPGGHALEKLDGANHEPAAKDQPRANDEPRAETPGTTEDPSTAPREEVSRRLGIFFSIYFTMTGLHALHVLAGMAAIAWVLVRAVKRHFHSQYFGPVDYVGLYWHLVDLIWIFLFPLLYLID
jgi:cytochrome c oxidase subunit III